MLGTLLGNRYEVINDLGEGGIGKTFIAIDTHLISRPRRVIKQLKPLEKDAEVYRIIKEKFQQEAAALEKLGQKSGQIPQLHAYFEAEGLFYLVQDWVEGLTLEDLVKNQGPLSEIEVKRIVVSLLEVLTCVQSQRMIHRDIKPANIILRQVDGLPVLIDFGAVKEVMRTTIAISGGTQTSVVIGSPGFMPNEQSAGRPIFASDIYALGLTAIYLLTGMYPQDLVDKQTGQFIWRAYVPIISSGFADILDKSIRDHFHERYLTAREMLDAIKALEPPPGGGTTVYEEKKNIQLTQKGLIKWKLATLTLSIITLILGTGGSFLIFQKQQAQSLISQLQNDLNDVENQLETANTEVNKLNATLDDVTQGQTNVEELAKKISSLESQVQNLQTENARINAQNSSLQSENQKLSQRIKDLTENPPQTTPTPPNSNTGTWGGRCGVAEGVQSDKWYKVSGDKDAYEQVKNLCPQDQPYITSGKVVVASFTSRSEANDLAGRLKAKTGYNFWVE